MTTWKINLGDKVRDNITGFEGIATALTEWLNGCRRITIQPQELKDGKPIEAHCFDIEQVVVVKARKLSSPTSQQADHCQP